MKASPGEWLATSPRPRGLCSQQVFHPFLGGFSWFGPVVAFRGPRRMHNKHECDTKKAQFQTGSLGQGGFRRNRRILNVSSPFEGSFQMQGNRGPGSWLGAETRLVFAETQAPGGCVSAKFCPSGRTPRRHMRLHLAKGWRRPGDLLLPTARGF